MSALLLLLTLLMLLVWLVNFSIAPVTSYSFALFVSLLQFAAVALAVARVAAKRSRRVSMPAALATLLVGVLMIWGLLIRRPGRFNSLADTELALLAVFLGVAVAYLVGRSTAQRRTYAIALHEQATEQAVTAERLRIARELHDVVAHSIGVIAIQAGSGARVIDTQPFEAANALRAIEETSRETLAALRRSVGSLRAERDGVTDEHMLPAPGLADLDRLVARTAAAGVRVSVVRSGPAVWLPPDLDLCAYRAVQESLTNVIRHSAAKECEVHLASNPGRLIIKVLDRGRGAHDSAISGFGLTGMRERVALAQGRFDAGSREGGGFHVTAELPVPASA